MAGSHGGRVGGDGRHRGLDQGADHEFPQVRVCTQCVAFWCVTSVAMVVNGAVAPLLVIWTLHDLILSDWLINMSLFLIQTPFCSTDQ